jgi:hypothetical protein
MIVMGGTAILARNSFGAVGGNMSIYFARAGTPFV